MDRRFSILLALVNILWFASTGCEPDEVTMRLLVYDQLKDEYVFDDVSLTTLDDVQKLEGEATEVKGGVSLVLNYQTDPPQIEWTEVEHSVAFSAIEQDGVLVPEDYDSLAMASSYYNVELSYLFFVDDLGLNERILRKLQTFYWPKVIERAEGGEEQRLLDNAFYVYLGQNRRALFVLPFESFQWVPVPLNSGIVTHEYSHYVYDLIVMEFVNGGLMEDSGMNFLYALNEGVADFMAVARTGDPDFIEHSIPSGTFDTQLCDGNYEDATRDASSPVNYTDQMDFWARNLPWDRFLCPYEIGQFIAALMYEISQAIDPLGSGDGIPSAQARVKVARWLLRSLEDLGNGLPRQFSQSFELWDLLSLFVNRIESESEKSDACSIIELRYKFHTEVAGCL